MGKTPWLIAILVLLVLAGCDAEGEGDVATTDANTPYDTGDVAAGTSDISPNSGADTPTPPDDSADAAEADAAKACICIQGKHCDENGDCVDDICLKGGTTCELNNALKVCNEDGSAFEIIPCGDDEVCYLGECTEPICDPDQAPTCENGERKYCNSLGVGYNFIPCPGNTTCADGECLGVQPNVILIVDTSGSMNAINPAGDYPADCTGDDCPPWTWPTCDDAASPHTRLGKMKSALKTVLTADGAANLRMALQRFPQNFNLFQLLQSSAPTCDGAPLWGLDLFSGDNATTHGTHKIEDSALEGASMGQILPVPFRTDKESNTDAILKWIDFDQSYAMTEETCTTLSNCTDYDANTACVAGFCGTLEEPELRAMGGNTPIGRSLFYAGEIMRHLVVLEGKACAADSDCPSPHYGCVDGACHDPYRDCRPNEIILFTDGLETLDVWPEKFFHPRVQAKRLHYGLGCNTDADCMNDATCSTGTCAAPGLDDPLKICHGTNVACTSNSECADFPYPCGGTASTCSGTCEHTGVTFSDDVGENVLRDATGAPIPITVHVVEATQGITDGSIIAKHGGGNHLQVDLDDVTSLVDGFTGALDIKADPDACEP